MGSFDFFFQAPQLYYIEFSLRICDYAFLLPVIKSIHNAYWAFLVAQTVNNLPAVQETWVQSLGWEDPLKKGMATHSSILTWGIPWTEESGGYNPWGCKRAGCNLATKQ